MIIVILLDLAELNEWKRKHYESKLYESVPGRNHRRIVGSLMIYHNMIELIIRRIEVSRDIFIFLGQARKATLAQICNTIRRVT